MPVFVCLSVSLPDCACQSLSVYMSVCLPGSACLSVYQDMHACLCVSICLSARLCTPVCLSVCESVKLCMFFFLSGLLLLVCLAWVQKNGLNQNMQEPYESIRGNTIFMSITAWTFSFPRKTLSNRILGKVRHRKMGVQTEVECDMVHYTDLRTI